MRKTPRLLLALIALLLLPQVALAHDFNQNNGLFFSANTGVYRQKTSQRPWQLVSLPDGSKIKQSISFDDKIWLIVEVGAEQHLYQQANLLNFTEVTSVAPAQDIVLKKTASNLIVFRKSGTEIGLTIFTPGGQPEQVAPPLLSSKSDLGRIIESDGELVYLQQVGINVTVFRQSHGWQPITQLGCAQSRVIEEPLIGLYCQNGTVIRMEAVDRWTELNLNPVRDIYSSEEILAGWDKIDDHLFRIWHSGTQTDIGLPTLVATEVDQIKVSGRRILFHKIEDNWRELIWQSDTPQLVELTDTSSGTVIPVAGSNNLMISGSVPQVSTSPGQWQLVTSVGTFSVARQTPLGLLIWNTGSLTQFAPTGSTVFTKVNPWSSTTSPIQAVEIGQATSFVSVITQSGNGNVNLYKTTDFTHWSRITLPTKPTLSPAISQVRTLTAGSLVEISGVITVGPKVVDSEVLYLEDETGGVQIFLSQTSGLLPTQTKIKAVATGEISTSQTKRVLLNSLTDLELGSASTWNGPIINPDQVTSYLGRSVQVKGAVSDTDTDYLTLGNLKLHFVGAKTIFQKDDQLIIPAVVDWNSASGHNEAWALSTDYQLIFRNQPATSTAITVSSGVSETVAPKKATVAKKSTLSTPIASSKPVPTVAGTSKPSETPVIVAGAESNNNNTDNQTISMSLVSLIAGLVSFRGRRFRRWLPD
ncbi:MAG: hypothetical protein Q7K33_00550 [Candidatus Berkelbacteria bacterium]|nr:hypothetical protein [Candidatus Berkelbacteria bacterium]